MNFEIVPIKEYEKEILRNLMEKYDYEFTQYTGEDVNPLGLYGYSWLDSYWKDPGRWAFFLKVDGKLAGFAMVNDYPEAGKTDYSMAEFFVMYKYRRCGLGSWAVERLFERFPGSWQIKYHPKNLPSAGFWNRVAEKHSAGGYRHEERVDLAYPDGSAAQVLFFETARGDRDISTVLIRDLESRDYLSMAAIWRDVFTPVEDESVANVCERMKGDSRYRIFVADMEGKVVGFVTTVEALSINLPDGYIKVNGLAVLPEYRRRGIGKMLMEHVEELARRRGISLIGLASGFQRTEAHEFYEHLGYQKLSFWFRKRI